MLITHCSVVVLAQDKKEKSQLKYELGMTSGYFHAGGNFVKNDYSNITSGYSNSNGFSYGIEGNLRFRCSLGIAVVVSNTSFYSKGLQTMADGYKEDFDVDSVTLKATGKYSFTNFLIGPTYQATLFARYQFDLRILGGLVCAKTPKYKVDLEDQAAATFYQNSASVNALGFQAGIGVSRQVLKRIALKAGVDYYCTMPNFTITNENRTNNAGRILTNYHQPISGFMASLNVIYLF